MSEKPEISVKSPVTITLKNDKNFALCPCGESAYQLWRNGSIEEMNLKPLIFSSEESKKSVIYIKKHTQNPPYFDGSHANL